LATGRLYDGFAFLPPLGVSGSRYILRGLPFGNLLGGRLAWPHSLLFNLPAVGAACFVHYRRCCLVSGFPATG